MFISKNEYLYYVILNMQPANTGAALLDKEAAYIRYQIPKKSGFREISALDKRHPLYKLQSSLLKNFFLKIPLPAAVKGFVKHESFNTYLISHTQKQFYMRLDIAAFFDSITTTQIDENLKEFVSLPEAREVIIQICTLHGKLPQGAVTSPAVSNLIFRRIDQRILKYCQKLDVRYTRYADDLFFSSDTVDFEKNRNFKNRIINILWENGFRINIEKNRTSREQIVFGGYVVEKDLHLSRKKLKTINQIIEHFNKNKHQAGRKYEIDYRLLDAPGWLEAVNRLAIKRENGRTDTFQTAPQFLDYLCGYRAFLISVVRANVENKPADQKNDHIKQLNKKIRKLEWIIDAVQNSRRK